MENYKMKKIIALICFLTIGASAGAFENIVIEEPQIKEEGQTQEIKPLQAEITFDWLDISVAQREEQIEKYKNLLFNQEGDSVFYTKEEFKKEFKPYKKDRNFKHHYMLTNNGVTEDEEAEYCAFYYKKNMLVMYAIKYKDNPHNAFYYSAFGKLYYVDVTSNAYPNYPYYSMQYGRDGKLKSAVYFISKDIQYMYGPDREFQGIWYKEKMYNKDGKQALTRTNW